MSFIDSATTMLSDAAKTVTTSVSEFAADIGLDFDAIAPIKLPLQNVLHDYATYDCVFTISALHDKDVEDPDNSYFKWKTLQPGDRYGKAPQIICKSANAEPNNRVRTDYGKFDFFVDDVTIEGMIGFQTGNNVSSTNLTFSVKEPYSMGLFTMSCQQAAWESDHQNWNAAPFLLTIEFRGNDEMGMMLPIPESTRYIPFKFSNVSMTVNQDGALYFVKAIVWNAQGLSDKNAKLTTDVSVKGTSVQEVLQTGEKSLQAVWNAKLRQLKEDKIVDVPDEIIILFPKTIHSDKGDSGAESSDSATSGSDSESTVYKKIGVDEVTVNNLKYHVQKAEDCNVIGKASLGFGAAKAADAPYGKENDNHTEVDGHVVQVRANNTPNPAECEFKFRQDTDIPNAINQVILQSNFPTETLDPDAISESGYKKWWSIDIQVYNISTDANYKSTGTKPKIIVYRVIPYNTHASSGIVALNEKSPGFENMFKNAIKEYNYLYTGLNTDVISFDIKIENSFSGLMAADWCKQSMDVKTSAAQGSEVNDKAVNTVAVTGSEPEKGTNVGQNSYTATFLSTDRLGGGGTETAGTRAARLYHDALTRGNDMINLDLVIVGDPAFLHHSGFGNYTSKPTQYSNLNADGTINYQMGEVHIVVNFRTPIDFSQETGMYQFTGDMPSSPLMQYSGLFIARQVTSTFKGGKFEQRLKCQRAPGQESAKDESKGGSFNMDKLTKDGLESIGKAIKSIF